MLVELLPHEIEPARLHAQVAAQFPLLQAVLRQKQRGQVFADRHVEPKALAVVTRFGFMGILGEVDDPQFATGLSRLLSEKGTVAPSYLLWYAPPAPWQDRLDKLGGPIRRRERTRFKFNRNLANYLQPDESLEAGVEVRPLDALLLPAAAGLGLQLESRFWSSADQLLAEGIGACALLNGEAVSVCYSACVVDGFAETDVATSPLHQGQGLAGLAARAYVRSCIGRGVDPTWDCFTANAPSMALANGLGFEPQFTYPLYSFNAPLHLG